MRHGNIHGKYNWCVSHIVVFMVNFEHCRQPHRARASNKQFGLNFCNFFSRYIRRRHTFVFIYSNCGNAEQLTNIKYIYCIRTVLCHRWTRNLYRRPKIMVAAVMDARPLTALAAQRSRDHHMTKYSSNIWYWIRAFGIKVMLASEIVRSKIPSGRRWRPKYEWVVSANTFPLVDGDDKSRT